MDCSSDTLVLVVVVVTTFIYYSLRRRKLRFYAKSTTAKLPPSPRRVPILGHLHLLGDMPHHSLARLAGTHGPIMRLQLGQVPAVVISSAELAREVLKTHDHVFCNRPQLTSAKYLSFGCSDVTFSSYGPYWRQARKICVSELLSPTRVSSFQLVRDEETSRLLAALSDRSGSEVDLSELLFTLANDVLCRVAFGRRFVLAGERKGRDLVGVLTETQELFAGFSVGDFFPRWGWVDWVSGYTRRLERNLKELRGVCDEIIEEHLKEEREKGGGEDFVDVLLRVQKQHDLEVPITDDNLKALVLDMFVAGTDTTSSTLEWTMTELVRHPEVMRKAQREVRGILPSGDGAIYENDLQQLHYLRAVIKETMRLHPAAPLLVPRESMGKCVISGYEIQPNTRVFINTFSIGRDPNSWENPTKYDPERFIVNTTNDQSHVSIDFKGQDFRFLPFGGGRRGCPGYSFALATIELTLARLLYHFDWELPSGVDADGVDLSEIFGLATRKKTPLVLVPNVNKACRVKKN